MALRLAEKAGDFDPLDETIYDTLQDIYDNGKIFYGPPLHHDGRINSAAFSSDGTKIVTASGDKTAKVWDVLGKELATLSGHKERVLSATFSPDNTKIVTASQSGMIKVQDLSGKVLTTMDGLSPVNVVMFSPNGKQILSSSGNSARIWDDFSQQKQKFSSVDEFLKSDRLAKLTLADQVLAGVITLEELPAKDFLTKEIVSNIWNIAQFYESKARTATLIKNQRKYLQQAAMLYQKVDLTEGQRIKRKIADLASSEPTRQEKRDEQSDFQQSLATGLENIPLIIFVGLLMLIISRQQKVLFLNGQYLRLAIYSIVPVVVLVNWLSFYDGVDYKSIKILKESGEAFWLVIHLTMAAMVASLCFFHIHKRFQHKILYTSLQIFCLAVFVLPIGLLVLGNLLGKMDQEDISVFLSFLGIAAISLLAIPLTYYAQQPSDNRKWLRRVSMLLAYAILLIVTASLVAMLDNALAFSNPIPTGLRFLLLLVAGVILGQAFFSQFNAYHKQHKWLTMGSFAVIYSVILYLSLINFGNNGIFTFPSLDWERAVFYYEIADALTLLLALIAAGFSIVWGIQAYQNQKYRETGVYALAALLLVSSAAYYFRAYMPMLSFFTVVFGGMLLFIHVVSRAFDKRRVRQA